MGHLGYRSVAQKSLCSRFRLLYRITVDWGSEEAMIIRKGGPLISIRRYVRWAAVVMAVWLGIVGYLMFIGYLMFRVFGPTWDFALALGIGAAILIPIIIMLHGYG